MQFRHLNVPYQDWLQLKGDFFMDFRVRDGIVMPQNYLLWVGSVICVPMAKGSIPDINVMRTKRT
jgi:hypothetical protein